MNRRAFGKWMGAAAFRALFAAGPLALFTGRGWPSPGRRILSPETRLETLLYEDPAHLDARGLPLTDLSEFGTMGLTEHKVDLARWRLSVEGAVSRPLRLRYSEILDLPVVERDVLLICPGVFAYHARWTGISVAGLLERAGASPTANLVEVSGPEGPRSKWARFPVTALRDEGLFLAHGVNGRPLPEKHGFPLRAVARGTVGSGWIKFADRIQAVTGEPPEKNPPPGDGPAFLP